MRSKGPVDREVTRLYYVRLGKAALDGIGVALGGLALWMVVMSGVLTGDLREPIDEAVAALLLTIIVVFLVLIVFCFTVIGPIAAALAWQPYIRGDKSYVTYILLGVGAALPVPLIVAAFLRDGEQAYTTVLFPLLFGWFGLWVVVSGGAGGWSFARRINTDGASTT